MAIIIERIKFFLNILQKIAKKITEENKIKNEILLLATNEPKITKIKTNVKNQNFFPLFGKKLKVLLIKKK